MTSDIKPGAARVAQVQGPLLADEMFKQHMGPLDAEIPRRDGTAVLKFHRLAYDVAVRLMADGKEPMQEPRDSIRNYARLVLDEQAENAAMSGAQATEPAPTPPPAEVAPKVQPAAPEPAPAVQPAPAARRSAKAASATPKSAPAKKAEPVKPAAAVVEPAAETAETPAEAVEEASAAKPPREPEINVALAVLSLVVSAQELAERDRHPGCAERRAALSKLAKSYRDVVAR